MKIIIDKGITQAEADKIVADEKLSHEEEILSIVMRLDRNEIVIATEVKSPIKRVRRITGYLSNLTSFNDAKTCEEHDRVKHLKV